jgi:O-antigen/teichoic acid export membrane protein
VNVVHDESDAGVAGVLDTPEAGPRVVRGSALRVGAYVGGLLVGLASTPLVVRHLGAVDFGRYATVSSLIFIVTALTEGGLAALGLREYSTGDLQVRRGLIRNLLGLRIVLVAVATVLATGFALVAGYTHAMVVGTVLLSGGLLLMAIAHTLGIDLSARLRLGWVSALEFIRQFATAIGMIALVVAGASLLPFFAVAPVTAAIVLALTVVVIDRSVPLLPSFARDEQIALLRKTVVYAAATALGVLYFQLAMILTSLVTGAHETGYFGVSFRIIELANGVPWLLATTAFPLIARAAQTDSERLRYGLSRMTEVALVAGVGVMLVTTIGAPFAIDVVAGHGFGPSVDALRIMGLAAPATFLIATIAYALLAIDAQRRMLIANGIAVVVMLIATPLLANSHGATGAAIGAVGTEWVLCVAYVVALGRERAELRLSLAQLPRILVAAGLAAAPAIVFALPAVVEAVLAVVIYAALALLLHVIPDEAFDLLPRRLRPRRLR